MDKEMENIKAAFWGIVLLVCFILTGIIEATNPQKNIVGAEPVPISQVNGVEYNPIVEETQNGL